MAKKERYSVIVDVHLFLIKGRKILLLLREHTGYEDGKYHVPAGHMDGGEPVPSALLRESKEEVGITIKPKDAKLVHVMHTAGDKERIGFFFEVKKWAGEIKNMEPKKHAEVRWFDLNKLPRNMVDYANKAINYYKKHQLLSQYGWASKS